MQPHKKNSLKQWHLCGLFLKLSPSPTTQEWERVGERAGTFEKVTRQPWFQRTSSPRPSPPFHGGEGVLSSVIRGQSQEAPLKKFLLVLALAALLGQTALAELKTGEAFPELAAFKLEGKLPDDLKGKVVIVDFWASWCGPCKESFPVLNELKIKYAGRGLVIIAVNVDEERADMEMFLKANPATFTIVRDATQQLVPKTGIKTMPSSFVLDSEGKVRFAHSGFHGDKTRKQYEEQIESLLKK